MKLILPQKPVTTTSLNIAQGIVEFLSAWISRPGKKNSFFVISVFWVFISSLFLKMSSLTNVIRQDANTCHVKSPKEKFKFQHLIPWILNFVFKSRNDCCLSTKSDVFILKQCISKHKIDNDKNKKCPQRGYYHTWQLIFWFGNFLPNSEQLERVASNKIRQSYGAHIRQYFCVKLVKIIILVDEEMDSSKFAFWKSSHIWS